MSKLQIFEYFLSVWNLKPELERFFKPKCFLLNRPPDKIDSALGRERHKKLFHSDGKFVQCSISKCTDILAVGALDEHVKEFHMVNLFCEQCGISFCDKKLYKRHYNMNHVEVECKVCKIKFPSRPPLIAHMRTHKGDPHPCHECGKEYPDKFILNAHIREAIQ